LEANIHNQCNPWLFPFNQTITTSLPSRGFHQSIPFKPLPIPTLTHNQSPWLHLCLCCNSSNHQSKLPENQSLHPKLKCSGNSESIQLTGRASSTHITTITSPSHREKAQLPKSPNTKLLQGMMKNKEEKVVAASSAVASLHRCNSRLPSPCSTRTSAGIPAPNPASSPVPLPLINAVDAASQADQPAPLH
jgi:hypothetical protein